MLSYYTLACYHGDITLHNGYLDSGILPRSFEIEHKISLLINPIKLNLLIEPGDKNE